MSIEELLIPRYKVIADYPDSPFGIGEVLELSLQHKVGTHLYPAYHITDEDGNIKNIVGEVWMEDYPAIFRRIPWTEGLEPNDLPDFVKNPITSEVIKIIDKNGFQYTGLVLIEGDDFIYLPEWIPATQSDYEAYQKQKH